MMTPYFCTHTALRPLLGIMSCPFGFGRKKEEPVKEETSVPTGIADTGMFGWFLVIVCNEVSLVVRACISTR